MSVVVVTAAKVVGRALPIAYTVYKMWKEAKQKGGAKR